MEKFDVLPEEKVNKIRSILARSPNSVEGYPWLDVYPCSPADVFDNQILLDKSVAAGIVLSGANLLGPNALYACDIVRKDRNTIDIDRHILARSGSSILRRKKIDKSIPEHHSSEIPPQYI